ncbi:NAD(P)-dependent oxidoreductase [Aquabacterium sp.]|uniref:NAD(P)-dependent oxidoreductase n=1 Tax=Aquabacterium sp. TaxID=1872578 RepID=UPI0037834672
MHSPPLLLLPPDPSLIPAYRAALLAADPSLDVTGYSRELDDAQLARIEVVLGWRLPPGLAPRLPRLRWVCSIAAGVEKLLVPELPPQVPVSRIVDPDQALGMAQHVALMVLRHARALPLYEQQQQVRSWARHPKAAARHRVAILGFGEVGRAIAEPLRALGFAVEGWRRDSGPLHALLARSDIVVNTLPLTPATQGLLDAGCWAAMPRGGYFINVARGGHVDEAALIAAVQSGQLAGAALDVQQTEPLPPDDPLWAVPGILITPHIAAQSSLETVAAQFVAGLRCLQRGEPLPHPVDRTRGY